MTPTRTLVARLSLTAPTRTQRSRTASSRWARRYQRPESWTSSSSRHRTRSARSSSPAAACRAASTRRNSLPTLAVRSTRRASSDASTEPSATSTTLIDHSAGARSGSRTGPGCQTSRHPEPVAMGVPTGFKAFPKATSRAIRSAARWRRPGSTTAPDNAIGVFVMSRTTRIPASSGWRRTTAMVVAAAVLLAPVAVSSSASATAATDRGPSLTHLVHFGSGLGSGSTIGPDGALYVTDGTAGSVKRVDRHTGAVSVYATGLPPRVLGIGGAVDVAFLDRHGYALVTMVGGDFVGGPHIGDAVVGIYRLDSGD